jgi:two-component system, OmpR family, sensor histidine kinase KdpD
MGDEIRPDPDELLARIREDEDSGGRVELKIFFGMSAGVGKTYAMLQEARAAKAQGIDIVLGVIETHGRPDTEALVSGLESMPSRTQEYRGIRIEELDLDALIARRPAIAVLDELAHSNAPGSRHVKRWQDALELLDRGISVWTAVNVQHMESYADVVEDLTGARVRERVPDTVFDRADEIRLIDVAPEDLIRRLEDGLIYTGDSSRAAIENFFKPKNLGALREIALRYAARMAGHRLSDYVRAESGLSTSRSQPREGLGERILVAVGPAPGSAYLLRWARRTAYALRADWTAIHVDTGALLNGADKERLEANLSLARKLGAEVSVVPGLDIVETVVATARAKDASMIVVGRSGLSRIGMGPRRATVSDRIMREAAPIDIAVVQDSSLAVKERPLAWLKRTFGAAPRQYALLVAAFAILAFLAKLLAPGLGYRSVALLFLAAILGLSFIARPGPVAILAVLSALALNFFFIPPLYTLSIDSPEDWVLFGVYFLVAFVTGSLVSRIHARGRLLHEREKAASFLFGAAQMLSECPSVEAAAEAAARLAEEHFSTEAAVFVDDGEGRLDPLPRGKASPRIDEREFDIAAYSFAERELCGALTDTLPSAALRYLPAAAGERAAGVIGLVPPAGRVWTRGDDNLLQSLGRTLALSVERFRSEARSRKAVLELESERLGSILLDSVSHELRTPLTTITGSLSALKDDALAEKGEARRALLANALEAADRLNDVVDDLLSLSRIESGMLRLDRRRVELLELARAAIARGGPELDPRRVEIVTSEEDGEAFVDVALAARLIANLLRNAAHYSPRGSAISLFLGEKEGSLSIRVRDRGRGLPEEELRNVFSRFWRGKEARGSGLGLGLAICHGIAQAHGGSVAASNAPDGGLVVEAILPGPRGGNAK